MSPSWAKTWCHWADHPTIFNGKTFVLSWMLLLLSRFSCVWLCATPFHHLWDPLPLCDSSPPGSPVPGILQTRTLEWVAISFSSAWKWKVKVKSLSRIWLLATPWTAAYQAPPSMGFSRQEYWSGVPLPSPEMAIKPGSSTGFLCIIISCWQELRAHEHWHFAALSGDLLLGRGSPPFCFPVSPPSPPRICIIWGELFLFSLFLLFPSIMQVNGATLLFIVQSLSRVWLFATPWTAAH